LLLLSFSFALAFSERRALSTGHQSSFDRQTRRRALPTRRLA
jgi:hypothetical protein